MNYIVFPGNVGDNDALLKVAITLGVTKKVSTLKKTGKDLIDGTPLVTSGPREGVHKHLSTPAVVSPLSEGYKNNNKLLSALTAAVTDGYAIAAFNVYNLEGAKAVVAAAESCGAPVILQVLTGSLSFIISFPSPSLYSQSSFSVSLFSRTFDYLSLDISWTPYSSTPLLSKN